MYNYIKQEHTILFIDGLYKLRDRRDIIITMRESSHCDLELEESHPINGIGVFNRL